jgi:hypothetical protein
MFPYVGLHETTGVLTQTDTRDKPLFLISDAARRGNTPAVIGMVTFQQKNELECVLKLKMVTAHSYFKANSTV